MGMKILVVLCPKLKILILNSQALMGITKANFSGSLVLFEIVVTMKNLFQKMGKTLTHQLKTYIKE